MGRPTKENSLTPQDVIEAAITCIDQEGESALGVNRVARSLGIKPPAIYKHLDGNAALRRAVVFTLWRRFLALLQQQATEPTEPRALLRLLGHTHRNFARTHPARYKVMMQFQMQPTDPEAAAIIFESLSFLHRALQSYEFTETELIDAMRIANAALYGFISIEQSGLMTLKRSTDASYEVMLDVLIVAFQHIRQSQE